MSPIHTPAMQRMLPYWLRRLFTPGRPAPYSALNYETKLLAARALSLAWGAKLPRFETSPAKLQHAAGPVVYKHLARALGHLNPTTVADHRFGLTVLIRDLIEHELQVPTLLTIGFVYQDDQRLSYTPVEQVERLLRFGSVVRADFPLHVWLTLPSHEIIDATFWAVHPALAGSNERAMRGALLDPAFGSTRSYHPQWLGEGIVRDLGLLKGYEEW